MNYKILVIMSMSNSEAKSVTSQLIEYDILELAEKALSELTSKDYGSIAVKIIPLW